MKPATPLPWNQCWHTFSDEDEAYARHACNAYPRLVYALNDARLQIEYLHQKFQETGSGNAVLASIVARLRELGELE